jgi:hypothetical protein
MQKEEPLEPPLFGARTSKAMRWLVSLAGAAATAIWVFSTVAEADQRLVWLMERARPACAHRITNKDMLHRIVRNELATSDSQEEALRAVIAVCERTPQSRETSATQ